MTDVDLVDDILGGLAAARGRLEQVWHDVEELKGLGRSAERAIDDVDYETTRARAATEDAVGVLYLRNAGDQMDLVRRRCADSAALAGEIERRLESVNAFLEATRQQLAGLDDAVLEGALPSAEVRDLRARVEDLADLVDLATPIAQAARTHMDEAASIAATLTAPSLSAEDRQHTTSLVDIGLRNASRGILRADEAARHLDRTVEQAMTGAGRSVGRAELVAAAARDRLRSAQRHESPRPASAGRAGLTR